MKKMAISILLGSPIVFVIVLLVWLLIIGNHELLLNYLKLFLSWPPLLSFIILCILILQPEWVVKLIERLKITIGREGIGIGAPYPEQKMGEEKQISQAATKETASADDPSKKIEHIDTVLNNFLKISLISNYHLINRLLGRLWKKNQYIFIAGIWQALPQEFTRRVEGLKSYLDPRAIEDLKYVEDIYSKKEKPRKEILDALLKSVQLREYLEDKVS